MKCNIFKHLGYRFSIFADSGLDETSRPIKKTANPPIKLDRLFNYKVSR